MSLSTVLRKIRASLSGKQWYCAPDYRLANRRGQASVAYADYQQYQTTSVFGHDTHELYVQPTHQKLDVVMMLKCYMATSQRHGRRR